MFHKKQRPAHGSNPACVPQRRPSSEGLYEWNINGYLTFSNSQNMRRAKLPLKEDGMDWDRIAGNCKQFGGKIKEKWGQLTDDDLTAINGRRDQLEGKIQERYGIAKDQVRSDVDTWLRSLP